MESLDQYMQLVSEVLPSLLRGAGITVLVTAASLAICVVAGVLVAVLRLSAWRPLRLLTAGYVELMRIFPVLTLLFLLYFGLPEFGVRMSALQASIMGLSIWGVAYLSEIYRGGIESIDHGQMEAAMALGMQRSGAMRHVVLPQSIRVVLPALVNFAIGLLKYSSVASTIGVLELMYNGRAFGQATYRGMEVMLMVAAIYLAMSLPLAMLAGRLQRHLGRHVHVAAR